MNVDQEYPFAFRDPNERRQSRIPAQQNMRFCKVSKICFGEGSEGGVKIDEKKLYILILSSICS
jgi:hypothetical protein